MADTGAQIFQYFRQRGLSPAAAAGLVGNAQQESGLNPGAPGGGLFQYIGGRAASGRGGLRQQLDATWRELSGPEAHTLAALRGARSPQQAALLFSKMFERPGIPMNQNRERYAAQAFQRYGHLAAGAGEIPNAEGEGGGGMRPGGTSPAQIASLLQLIDGGQQQSSLSVEGLSPRKPVEQGEGPPQRPAAPAEPQKGTSLTDALALIDQIGEQGEAPRPASESEGEGGGGGEPGGVGHEVNPIPGARIGRTDMGVDANLKPGDPIRALGNAKILGISPDWYAGQPYLYYEVLNEHGQPHPTASFPDAGKVVYVAEQITPHVHAGQYVRAGARIATYAGHGTGIETGLGTRGSSRTLAQSTTGYHEGQVTPAGRQALALLHRLGAR